MMDPVRKPVKESFKPDDMHMSEVNPSPGYRQCLELLRKAIDVGVSI